MGILRKLFKWLLVLVAVVAVAVMIVVWPVLGVNPFEGRADHLWELVSSKVHFFVRCAGTGTLQTELADELAGRPGFEGIDDARLRLLELTESIREQAEIPFDAVEVDFDRDFLAKEWAFAGTVFTDYSRPRADNFIFLTRVAFYGRFVSALQRGFVRDKLPPDLRDRIQPEKGHYVRIRLTPEELEMIQPFRSVRPREEPNVIYLGRIRDVLLISDNSVWMDDAIKGGGATLDADPWFQTEFARNSLGGDSLEVFLRPSFSGNMMLRHGVGPEARGPLAAVSRVLPVNLTGEVAMRLDPQPNGIGLHFNNNPPSDGYKKLGAEHDYVRKLYEAEKGDLRLQLSENGIGRFIPEDNVVAALLLCADPEEFAGLVLALLTPDQRKLLDDQARAGGYQRGFERLLRDELTRRLGDEHLVVLHRPTVFEDAPWHVYYESDYELGDRPFTPEPGLHVTLLSRVRDGVAPDTVRRDITKHLGALGLQPGNPDQEGGGATDPSGRLHLAQPIRSAADLRLIRPAYGAMTGRRPYVVFSTHVEAATAVFDAADAEDKQKIREPATRLAVRRVPDQGTLAVLAFGDEIADALADRVRLEYEPAHDPDAEAARIRKKYESQYEDPDSIELWERVREEKIRYVERTYPEFRRNYLERLMPLRAFDTIAFGAELGLPPNMGAAGRGFAALAVPEGAGE